MDFIPANESRFYIWFFTTYTQWLMRRRFASVQIRQEYNPDRTRSTIYYLNHTSWWDGLIPLYLNKQVFKQQARALMEDKQMQEHRFFSKIGAFSINLNDPRSSIRSLRYAVESLKRPNSCLFIYPEGRINPPGTTNFSFKNGLSWIISQTPEADIVPIAIQFDFSAHSKPDLHITIGERIDITNASKDQFNQLLINGLQQLMNTGSGP
ncbi:MAG: lysophospholipid acyltransferase family protein [Bacteroidota bacterium]